MTRLEMESLLALQARQQSKRKMARKFDSIAGDLVARRSFVSNEVFTIEEKTNIEESLDSVILMMTRGAIRCRRDADNIMNDISTFLDSWTSEEEESE